MDSINKVIVSGNLLRERIRLDNGSSNVKSDPYCGFKSDVERRKALGTRDRWKYGAFITVTVVWAVTNSKVDLQGLLAWLK